MDTPPPPPGGGGGGGGVDLKNLRLKRFWGPNLRLKEKRWENSKNIKFPYKSPPQAEIFGIPGSKSLENLLKYIVISL